MKNNLKNSKIMKELSDNHRVIFEQRLKKELHQKPKGTYIFLKIAATIILILGLGYYFVPKSSAIQLEKINEVITLGSLSPELEKIENYYTNAIAFELTQLDVSKKNKPILDKYLEKLGELTTQYKKESAQLNIDEINENSINALIDNLQLRLQLLLQLKEKLNTIKNKKDEQSII